MATHIPTQTRVAIKRVSLRYWTASAPLCYPHPHPASAPHLPVLLLAPLQVEIFDMMDSQQRQDCLKEVKILQSLEHENIVRCHASFIQVQCCGSYRTRMGLLFMGPWVSFPPRVLMKYKTIKEFATNASNAYQFAIRHKINNEICRHMK